MRMPCDARVSAMPTDPGTAERAISALEDYWSHIGRVPAPNTVERVRAAIEGRLAADGYGTHWQSLLDDALADLDYSADWAGQRIRSLTLWGSPPGAEGHRHQTRAARIPRRAASHGGRRDRPFCVTNARVLY
jgi:hypothetical protein